MLPDDEDYLEDKALATIHGIVWSIGAAVIAMILIAIMFVGYGYFSSPEIDIDYLRTKDRHTFRPDMTYCRKCH